MIEATEQDKSQLINILRNSFKDNGSVNYVINPRGDKDKRLEALMDYSINMCMAYGKVFMNESKTACALMLHPEQKKSNLIWDLQLAIRVIGLSRVFKVLQRESKINSFHPKELNSFFYLWFIGVDTSSQH
ncbi:hypothetical protein [Fulvivirga ligni]|uniref:hypothetical protein n=1 Tax=Fulvivirga ligni TaxID=2904246 RepID=UPI001F23D09E|nr:hypothetical protein [Fulvivirga ligni]UII21396.1 hypothetical protein LVD16_26565 [Fulvivirga ligni]